MLPPARLPTNPRLRAIALVERSLPNPQIEPTPEAQERRTQANQRAVLYAKQDEVGDSMMRLRDDIEGLDDGVVVDMSDPDDSRSVRHHLAELQDHLGK